MFPRVLALFTCLVVSAGVVARADRAEPVPIRQTLDRFPVIVDGWQGVAQAPFAKDVLAGSLASNKDIKMRVKDWQADHLRA